ncbi:MAG: ABC transporter ATP-binding protein, partial [Alphaproteobacteria bacterium]|nr:ABC transporter ATP-binding protein [Alphaproteobacteria bacterium]
MLEVKSLSKDFGGLQVIHDLSLSVTTGERRVILGPNGAGK